MRIVLQPEYVKKFICDGSKCQDNCCKGLWHIYVDEEHYKKIKKVNDKDLKDKINKYIRKNRSNSSPKRYGRLHQDKELNQCVFLTEDNKCQLQMKLGEDYLWDVCMLYPRYTRKIDNKAERSLTLSCPEVARLVLFNPEGIIFETYEESENTRIDYITVLDTEGHLYLNKLQRYFWDIRLFSLSLLQNRNYPLDDRMTILGIAYQNIVRLEKEKNLKEIPELLEKLTTMIEESSFKEELSRIPTDTQIQMKLAKEMTDKKILEGVNEPRYINSLREMLLGIGYVPGEDIKDVHEKYLENYNSYYKPYITEKEYVLENYIVNEYFREMMPLGDFKSIWDSYLFLVAIYSMTKLNLIGVAGYREKLNEETILDVIQPFAKVVLHNPEYTQNVISLLKDNGFDTMAYMSILIKN